MTHRLIRACTALLLVLAGATAASPAVHGAAAGAPAASFTGAADTQAWGDAIDHGMSVGPLPGTTGTGWSNLTLRQVANISLGGSQLRIHLSNEFATNAVVFGHVSVAPQLNGSMAAAAPTMVTFGGATSVTLAAGAEAVSDPVTLATTPGERLLLSLYLPPSTSVVTANAHTYSGQTNFAIAGRDATADVSPPVNNTFNFASYLGGIDVDASTAQTVVAIGDSITDLGGAPVNADDRWPDYLSRRIPALAVIDQGISGNQVLTDQGSSGGPSLQHRFKHDALDVTGARTVVIEDGLNDLRAGASASALEPVLASLVASAHAAGLQVLLTTITPCAGNAQCTAAFETQRLALNDWIRSGSSGADGYADFAAAVGAGSALAGMYDSGDHIHPGPAGMLAMALTVDTAKL